MKKKFAIILAIVCLVITLGVIAASFLFKSKSFRESVAQTVVSRITSTSTPVQTSLVHRALGFEEPQTYLLLFLNNTELRPSGGFIGSYGVVRFTNGIPELLKVEGTEILDHSVPQDIFEEPPLPLKKYLQITKWQFRDSNWSPDFGSAVDFMLSLYVKEKGTAANEIDGVIGITPTVIERVLAISGPITVNGVTFSSSNFTRTLEHEVEFGYADRGLAYRDRKQMLKDVARSMLVRMTTDVFKHWTEYTALLPDLLDEKQVVMHSFDSETQGILRQKNWAGLIPDVSHDYLLWVDANLGALKTDLVMDRNLTYTIEPRGKDFVATASMELVHKGKIDKFTTRYRDYARVYVPSGSKLIHYNGFMEIDRSKRPGITEQGIENGKQWFGSFVAVEPGQKRTVLFQYILPNYIADQIRQGQYNLLVQKQIGTLEPRLTLNLNFGKKIVNGMPEEAKGKQNDKFYSVVSSLKLDRAFQVTLGD